MQDTTGGDEGPGVSWRGCDLFSALDTERALEGADVGVYLIHSMLPSARLTQGSFADLDLILADNFARAASRARLYPGRLHPRRARPLASPLIAAGGRADAGVAPLAQSLRHRMVAEARVHLWVMHRFARHLAGRAASAEDQTSPAPG